MRHWISGRGGSDVKNSAICFVIDSCLKRRGARSVVTRTVKRCDHTIFWQAGIRSIHYLAVLPVQGTSGMSATARLKQTLEGVCSKQSSKVLPGVLSRESDQAPKTHEEHEALCSQCGKCCYKKIIVGSTVFITPFPCEYLDTETNLCTVYERRHEANPECLNMVEGMKHSAFPADCGYVPAMAPKGYRPAIDTWHWNGEWSDFDHLADQLDVSDETREKVRARGPWAPPMWVDANERIAAQAAADAKGRESCEQSEPADNQARS